MKNFFKKLFGDKYHERARKKNRIECVYAGPEQMARRFNRMEKVYAGPPTRDKDDNNAMEDVYAGPDPEVGPDETPAGPDGECEGSGSGAAKDLKRDKLKGLDPDAYYYEAVLWAAENGITLGTGDGKFSPDNDCLRAQIVTFLYRAYTQE